MNKARVKHGSQEQQRVLPEAQFECQHVLVSTECDTENKVQLIDIICHYLREQAHQLKEYAACGNIN